MALGSLANFRSNARGAVSRFPRFVAASALLAGSALFSPPVIAKDQITSMPSECAPIVDRTARLDCGTNYYSKKKADADARGAAADARGAAADKEIAITLALQAFMNYIKTGTGIRFTKDEVLAAADGKLNRENVCGVARKFGYDKSASLDLK